MDLSCVPFNTRYINNIRPIILTYNISFQFKRYKIKFNYTFSKRYKENHILCLLFYLSGETYTNNRAEDWTTLEHFDTFSTVG